MPVGQQGGVKGENPRPIRPKAKGAVSLMQKVLVCVSVKGLRLILANASKAFANNANS